MLTGGKEGRRCLPDVVANGNRLDLDLLRNTQPAVEHKVEGCGNSTLHALHSTPFAHIHTFPQVRTNLHGVVPQIMTWYLPILLRLNMV